MRRLVLLPLLSVLTLLGISAPADAAQQNFNVIAQSDAGGYGRAAGWVNFQDKNTFSYYVAVEDICPGDGMGVGVRFYIMHRDGTDYFTGIRRENSAGCDEQSNTQSSSISNQKRIAYVRAQVCFYPGTTVTCAEVGETSTIKNNPFV